MPQEFVHRALILAAVSTPDQARKRADDGEYEDKYSIPNQLSTCRAVIERRGWVNVGEIIIPGHSRHYDFLADLARDCPEYADMLERIAQRQATVLMVAYADRAFRGTILAAELAVHIAKYAVQFYDCAQPVEPVHPDEFVLTAFDKLMYSFRGYAAESYVERLQQNAVAGMRSRVKERRLPMMPKALYGWRNVGPDQPYEQEPEEAGWVRWMWERRVRDLWGWPRIASELNRLGVRTRYGREWTRVTVRQVLCNPFHAGWVRWGDVYERGRHTPMFTDAEWAALQAANERLAAPHMVRRGGGEFTGLCICGVCGRGMGYTDQRRALRCNRYSDGRDGIQAHSNYYPVPRLRAYLIAKARETLNDLERYTAWRQQAADDGSDDMLAQVERQLQERAREDRRWLDAYGAGVIGVAELKQRRAVVAEAVRALQAERRRLQDEAARRAAVRAEIAQLAPTQAELAELLDELPRLSWERRRWVYQQLFAEIRLRAGHDPEVTLRR